MNFPTSYLNIKIKLTNRLEVYRHKNPSLPKFQMIDSDKYQSGTRQFRRVDLASWKLFIQTKPMCQHNPPPLPILLGHFTLLRSPEKVKKLI